MRFIASFIWISALAGPDWRRDWQDLKPKGPVSYERHIEPILVRSCIVCHSGNVKEGKLDMSTYDALMRGGRNGPPIKVGKAEESILYHAVAHTKERGQRPRPMPPKGVSKLSPDEVAAIKQWIDAGAKAPTHKCQGPEPK